MRGFQNGFIFLILAKGLWSLNFSALKMSFFRQDLEATFISGAAPKRKDLMEFFCNFWRINTHLSKNDLIFENKSLFHEKPFGAGHEKNFQSQSCDIWYLGPKIKFRVI